MLVIGDKEMAEGKVAIRSRKEGDLGTDTIEEFISKIKEEISNKVNSL